MNHLYDYLRDITFDNSNIRTRDFYMTNLFIGDDVAGKSAFLAAVNKAVVEQGELATYIADDRETDVMGLSDAWYFMDDYHSDTKAAALKLIKTIYPDITSVYIDDNECEMHVVMKDEEEAVSLHDMSEGYCRLLKIIIGCGIVRNGVVVIDDVDDYFNTEQYLAIWEFLAHATHGMNNQVLIAVRNTDHIKSYAAWLDRNAGVIDGMAFRIDKENNTKKGMTIAIPYPESELKAWLASEQ